MKASLCLSSDRDTENPRPGRAVAATGRDGTGRVARTRSCNSWRWIGISLSKPAFPRHNYIAATRSCGRGNPVRDELAGLCVRRRHPQNAPATTDPGCNPGTDRARANSRNTARRRAYSLSDATRIASGTE